MPKAQVDSAFYVKRHFAQGQNQYRYPRINQQDVKVRATYSNSAKTILVKQNYDYPGQTT